MMRPYLLSHHRLAEHLTRAQRAGEVGLDDAMPVGLVHLEGRGLLRRARDRQEDVDLAEGFDALVTQAIERGDVGDVGGDRQRAAAALLNLGGHGLDELHAAAARHDVGARVGQTEGERAADSARTSDNDGRAAGQIKKLHEV